MTSYDQKRLESQLQQMRLGYIHENYSELARKAAEKQNSHVEYLAQVIDGEFGARDERSTARRIKNAQFPFVKTLEEYQWSHPKKVNRMQIQNLFRLDFIKTNTNVVFIGNSGVGKTHLSAALGRAACFAGHSVLFTTAIDIVNTLSDARSAGQLRTGLQRYAKPAVLHIDELGYLPIDRFGADVMFQVFSSRYERASTIVTTNRVYKHWAQIFHNDTVLTSAILDRVLHHVETVIIEGKSFRNEVEV